MILPRASIEEVEKILGRIDRRVSYWISEGNVFVTCFPYRGKAVPNLFGFRGDSKPVELSHYEAHDAESSVSG